MYLISISRLSPHSATHRKGVRFLLQVAPPDSETGLVTAVSGRSYGREIESKVEWMQYVIE